MKKQILSDSLGMQALVTISDLNHDGEGVGRLNNLVTFVPTALPGEEVLIRIVSQHKNFFRARVIDWKKKSPDRIAPPCPYFQDCGGCQLQHLSYTKQLEWKEQRVASTLKRIGNIEIPVAPIKAMENPYRYRNKASIHLSAVKNKIMAGFFEQNSKRVIDINDCLIQHPLNNRALNVIRNAIAEYHNRDESIAGLKALIINEAELRTSFSNSKILITLTCALDNFNPQDISALTRSVNEALNNNLAGLVLRQKDKAGDSYNVLSGNPFIEEVIDDFRFHISPQSFFQVNPLQADQVFKIAAAFAGKPRTAFDLYCGTGTFALYLSRAVDQIIGVDSEKTAIIDAEKNAAINGVSNVRFINARTEEITGLLDKEERPITIILNPPRKGCSPALLNAIRTAKPERIVYISCNPATLARDLDLLQQNCFQVKKVQPVDMFPQTTHVECVVWIEKR
jgi:23S rRNA (uracil1939-C5)-methyltransferase